MEIVTPFFFNSIRNHQQELNSMSQDYHHHHHQAAAAGFFTPFSNGFDRSLPSASVNHHQDPQQFHIAQQIRKEKLRLQGFDPPPPTSLVGIDDDDEDQSGGLHHVYDSAGMLSEMFNFPPTTGELLEHPSSTTTTTSFRMSRPTPEMWFGSSRQMNHHDNRENFNHHHQQQHHQINQAAAINAESAVAMQLFLMNPNPRSPSPPPPPPQAANSSSTLHMLLPNPSSSLQGGSFGQFTWVPNNGQEGSISNNPNEALSLSLSSSLQHLEAAKAEELRMGGDSQLLYQNPNHQQIHVGIGSSLGVVNSLRNSKYVKAAQELLEEFCSVGRGQFKKNKLNRNLSNPSSNPGTGSAGGGNSSGGVSSSTTTKDQPPLSAADRIEHQRRKVKLLSMLDEVDRRYNHYCEQMQMVVNSFDIVMGFGAAVPYTALAQKAMSRHFRCLKDAISAQLKHSCEMLGEKDGGRGTGITKGETPRLKILEQSLRQQRAFHQMGMMEQEAWRPQRGLPERSVNILRAWLFEHFLHPYPSDADKHLLARQTGLSRNQVSNWFINARVRLWKPMVEEMYQQEAKDDDSDEREMNQNSSLSQTPTPTSATPSSTTPPPPPPPPTPVTTTSTSTITTTPISSTPIPKRSHINENDPSIITINRPGFSENQAKQNQNQNQRHYHHQQQHQYSIMTTNSSVTAATTTSVPPPMSQCFPPSQYDSDMHDTCRRVSIVAADHQFGTTSGNNTDNIGGPTVIRFGTTSGDVSLTLGLRHAGNLPEKNNSSSFSLREFGGC